MPSHTHRIFVRTASRHYPVCLGYGLLERSGSLLPVGAARRLYVISSPRVWRLWGRVFRRGLRRAGIHSELLLLDDREEQKRLATLERLARELLRRGADRGALVVALGGGVVGDVAGFLAASYMRGLDYVQVPTTLVAQIDSAIGGKTGVNLREGKNLLGAFHQPALVLVDPQTLATLPKAEFSAGLYELVKYAVISDTALFGFLERHLETVKNGEPRALLYVIERAIRQKARVVSADERERHQRRILNFGHTFGHALEALARYRGLRHGEAVGWGMLMATRLAERLGRIKPAEAERIARLVRAVGRLPRLGRVSPRRLFAQLHADKKRRGEALVFVLPQRIGRVAVTVGVPRAALLRTLKEFLGSDR
ncbi:MAG: 3-dehydroquinate synthase [Terriglobia bacterium]